MFQLLVVERLNISSIKNLQLKYYSSVALNIDTLSSHQQWFWDFIVMQYGV